MKRVVGVLAGALVIGLLGALPGSPPAIAGPQAVSVTPSLADWERCGALECSVLTVPLDYANPGNGKTVRLAVTKLAAVPSAGAYAGALVLNPGGPGASGTWMPLLRADYPGTAVKRYDWVGFDPRGVGSSSPALHCNTKYFGSNRPNFVPTSKALRQYWVNKTVGYSRACGASAAKSLLPHMSTRDSARDIESLRVALQAAAPSAEKKARLEKINYYGFSYGTYLGAVYATLYPARVGRLILDSVVDPNRYWYGSNLDQSIAFDKNLNRFFSWVARRNSTYRLGTKATKIRAGYQALLKKLDQKPAAGGKLGPNELGDAMLAVAYDVGDWSGTAADYARLVRTGQGNAMYARYAGSSLGADAENAYAVYLAVQCSDQRPPGWSKIISDTQKVHKTRPFMAWNNTWYNMPCRTWPAPARGKVAVNGSALKAPGVKVLLINETYDAATPFSGALNLRGLFPTASLIEGVGGTTHAGSMRGVPCVANRVATYLATGATPTRVSGRRSDLKCSAVPRPSGRVVAKAAEPNPLHLRLSAAPGWVG